MGLRKKSKKNRRETARRAHGKNREALIVSIIKSDNDAYISPDQTNASVPCYIFSCIHCGTMLTATMQGRSSATVEHIVPTSAGGSGTDLLNLALACSSCNSEKGVRHDPVYPSNARAAEVISNLLSKRAASFRLE